MFSSFTILTVSLIVGYGTDARPSELEDLAKAIDFSKLDPQNSRRVFLYALSVDPEIKDAFTKFCISSKITDIDRNDTATSFRGEGDVSEVIKRLRRSLDYTSSFWVDNNNPLLFHLNIPDSPWNLVKIISINLNPFYVIAEITCDNPGTDCSPIWYVAGPSPRIPPNEPWIQTLQEKGYSVDRERIVNLPSDCYSKYYDEDKENNLESLQ